MNSAITLSIKYQRNCLSMTQYLRIGILPNKSFDNDKSFNNDKSELSQEIFYLLILSLIAIENGQTYLKNLVLGSSQDF